MAQGKTRVAITIKAPAELHAALTAWAQEEERSLSGQVLYLLRRAVAERERRRREAPPPSQPEDPAGSEP